MGLKELGWTVQYSFRFFEKGDVPKCICLFKEYHITEGNVVSVLNYFFFLWRTPVLSDVIPSCYIFFAF